MLVEFITPRVVTTEMDLLHLEANSSIIKTAVHVMQSALYLTYCYCMIEALGVHLMVNTISKPVILLCFGQHLAMGTHTHSVFSPCKGSICKTHLVFVAGLMIWLSPGLQPDLMGSAQIPFQTFTAQPLLVLYISSVLLMSCMHVIETYNRNSGEIRMWLWVERLWDAMSTLALWVTGNT